MTAVHISAVHHASVHLLVYKHITRMEELTSGCIANAIVRTVHDEPSKTDNHGNGSQPEHTKKTELLSPAEFQA
jgi:hypothetical protein